MNCVVHGIYQPWGEDCPECMREEQDTEDNAHARSMDMLTEQEQTGGTDVLPVDEQCLCDAPHFGACICNQPEDPPTDQAKSDCSGCPLYQAKQHKSGTVSVELTRAELDWLRVVAVCAPWSDPEDLAMGNRVYKKLKRSS